MSELRIRISAYVDRSFDQVMRTVAAANTSASRKVASESESTARVRVRSDREVAREAEKLAKQTAKEQEKAAKQAAKAQAEAAKQGAKEVERAQTEASKALAREWKEEADKFIHEQKRKSAAAKSVMKEMQAERGGNFSSSSFNSSMNKLDRDHDRGQALAARQARDRRRGMVNAVGTGFDIATGAARYGLDVASDIAQGAGMDFGLGSNVRKNVGLERMATDLSNSGFMSGEKGPNGQRVDPNALVAAARQTGMDTGTDSTKVLEGLQKFVGLSGDLDTGRKVIGDLAFLSKATGTELDDAAAAAGNLVMQLGDIPDKAGVISQIMRSIAGQGKLGAVEISDMASQMAKLASAASRFEGNVADNVALMGAFAQESRQRGGSASATQAASSVGALINTFVTPARMAKFEAITGKKVTNANGFVRNPETLLMEALHATKGDPEKFKQIFANVAGGRAVEGFATIYRQAGGGASGELAVHNEFERLKMAAMGLGEVSDSFTVAMKTTESQVTRLNEMFGKATKELAVDIVPVLQAVTPGISELVKDIGGITSHLLGIGDVLGYRRSTESTGDTMGAGVRLENKFNRGTATDKDVESAKAAIAKADEEIKRQKKELEHSPADMILRTALRGTGGVTGKWASDEDDRDSLVGQQLKWAIEQRELLARIVAGVEGVAASGVLNVKVTNQTVNPNVGPPKLSPTGVEDANSKTSHP